jgi:DNA polymerase III delta prime subunit
MAVCSDYYWFNPARFICSSAEGFVRGLKNGAGEGVENSIDYIKQTFANRIGNISSTDLGQRSSEATNKFIEAFFTNLNKDENGTGAKIGHVLNHEFSGFLKGVNLNESSKKIVDEITKAWRVGLENAHIADNLKIAAKEVHEGMSVFRENFYLEVDAFRSDMQTVFANFGRDTFFRVAPWFALTGAIMVATPLLISYIYYRAKHNIGRPKLATEIRYVGWFDKTYDAATNAVAELWKAAKVGVKYSAATAAAGLGVSVPIMIADQFHTLPQSITNPSFGIWKEIGCRMAGGGGYEYVYIDGEFEKKLISCSNMYLPLLLASSVTIGGIAAMGSLVRSGYQAIKKSFISDPKPIFSDELDAAINEIAKATYNIQKHDGFLQNVILYGPGGTGKTMVGKKIARNSGMNYIYMSGGDLAQHIKRNEHVTEINKLFERAKSSRTPTILFVDEAESLCRRRDKVDNPERLELETAFLSHTGEASKNVSVILATNRLEDIDPAVLSRMDHKLYIGPPAALERKKILEEYIPKFFSKAERGQFFTNETVQKIANATDGLTGRAIFKMLNALSSRKQGSIDNRLTKQMINSVVTHFVNQEKQSEQMRNQKDLAQVHRL